MQFNTRITPGMVVLMLPVESIGLILLEWIMKLQEKAKGLGGVVFFDAGHCGLGQRAKL